jgi:signal transduction histidine kinase
MLPTSHRIPITSLEEVPVLTEASLSDSFAAFVSAASRLESTHQQLHTEVARLRVELEERNQALASSLRENERMRALQTQILNALPCGVAVVERESQTIVLLNSEAEKMMGIAERRDWTALPSAMQAMIASKPSQAWRDGDEQQISITSTDASRWIAVRCTTIPGYVGTSAQTLILTLRDTTSQKQAEEQREAARNMVALSEIATVLAHEIRNPLGSMELFADLLCTDSQIGEEGKKWVQCLQAGLRSLSATVNNVLRFHAPGAAPLTRVKLSEAIAAAVEFILPLAKQSGVDVRVEQILGDTEIMGDAASLQQLLLNLACNALRHTAAGGYLDVRSTIESRENGKHAVIEFSDSGSGIAPGDLPHIFEAGFSTDAQRTGLGLAVCQGIMRQHHGEISVQSVLGSGTTFRMEFPIV